MGDRITYRWQLQTSGGWLIQLMNRADPHPTLPNGIVRFTSLPLMRFGTVACWKKALEWMEAFDAEVIRACLGRVDPCVDMAGMSIEQLDKPFRAGHYVSRARLSREHGVETPLQDQGFGRKSTGFSLGSSQKRMRAYDKERETRNQPEKRALLVERRWGEVAESAVRVEFQLRRESLKQFGVDSVDDYFANRAAIVWDLCENWFRLTDGPVDPKHPERSRVMPLWWEVALAFADWAGDAIEVELRPLAREVADLSQLKNQLYGLTQSVLVRSERPVASLDDFVHEGMNLLLSVAERRDVAAEFRRKAFLLGLQAGGQP
ncbi:MAG: replication initiation factor domain-containing protein [Planctomycetota bacterium]